MDYDVGNQIYSFAVRELVIRCDNVHKFCEAEPTTNMALKKSILKAYHA